MMSTLMLLWEPMVGIEEIKFKPRPKYWARANQEKSAKGELFYIEEMDVQKSLMKSEHDVFKKQWGIFILDKKAE